MLHPADILVDRHPVGCGLAAEAFRVMRIRKAKEVPGTFEKGIERILFTGGRAATCRAGHMLPGRMVRQRVARRVKINVLGKRHRKIGLRNRNLTTAVTVNDRDRASPITLARNTPVAKPVCGPPRT